MMRYGSVVHDPTGQWDTDIPLDRERHEQLLATVLDWGRDGCAVPPRADIDQAVLQLSGYAHLLVRETHKMLARLPRDPDVRSRAAIARLQSEITLGEAARRLRAPAIRAAGGLGQARSRARLVQALHSTYDRVAAALPELATGP
ncbi:hypothetical protein [Streptomyces sp. TLI_105]|uniref:hypothetical protein n=1 Tax=Streptomyces sp. TLI_105 TaxID=1881019 RepID=UPI000899D8E6|nr:hypothetical protein [Streptomyces sp. TLI_105]SEE60306.1 hypothetical protein SAMN05428939_8091 [Streptomyces sp. TLI_105]